MFGNYHMGFTNEPNSTYITLHDGLVKIFNLLKKLNEFDPDFFNEITMYNSDSKGGKIIIDLTLSANEIYDLVIEHYIFYNKATYKRLDDIILTPESTNYNGFGVMFRKYDKNNNRQFGFDSGICSLSTNGIGCYIDTLKIDRQHDWYVSLFKYFISINQVLYAAFVLRSFMSDIYIAENHPYIRVYPVGNMGYVSNNVLNQKKVKKYPEDIEIEHYLNGKIFYIDKAQLFDKTNEVHIRKATILQEFFLKNELYEY